jgi:hypothetical protein
MDEIENNYRFIRYIEETEQLAILKTHLPGNYVNVFCQARVGFL